jgi:hypothetical protein
MGSEKHTADVVLSGFWIMGESNQKERTNEKLKNRCSKENAKWKKPNGKENEKSGVRPKKPNGKENAESGPKSKGKECDMEKER